MLDSGELVLLISPKGKRYLRIVKEGNDVHTNDGMMTMESIAAAGYGKIVKTHLGRKYKILKPTVYDLIKGVKRQTQIMYPKEIGYLMLKLGVGPGARVIESGSGSGGLTVALAYYVGDTGKVYTHERRPEFYKLVTRNLKWAGLEDRVEQFNLDIEDGFQATEADALFLDVRTPWDYLHHIPKAVIPGAMCGFLLPTTNQVSDLLRALEQGPFEDLEVVEILVRHYKPVPDRLRPEDRMVAHTGFLVFARCIEPYVEEEEPAAEIETENSESISDGSEISEDQTAEDVSTEDENNSTEESETDSSNEEPEK